MTDLFKKYSEQVKEYCIENGLDYKKLNGMGISWNGKELWFHYIKLDVNRIGLLDETPAPIVLIMEVSNQGVVFKQTEYTKQYLR